MNTANVDAISCFDSLALTSEEKKSAAEEAAKFLMSFSMSSDTREQYASDPKAVLSEARLSEAARQIITAPNSSLLLRELHHASAAMLAVIIIETVTTEVMVF